MLCSNVVTAFAIGAIAAQLHFNLPWSPDASEETSVAFCCLARAFFKLADTTGLRAISGASDEGLSRGAFGIGFGAGWGVVKTGMLTCKRSESIRMVNIFF